MNSWVHGNTNNVLKSIEEKRKIFLKAELQRLNIENDENRNYHLGNTTVIAFGKNHQWMLELVAESLVENRILKLYSLDLFPLIIHVNYKGKNSNFMMEK